MGLNVETAAETLIKCTMWHQQEVKTDWISLSLSGSRASIGHIKHLPPQVALPCDYVDAGLIKEFWLQR